MVGPWDKKSFLHLGVPRNCGFKELGLDPAEIECGKIHDCFEVREPSGTMITFNSSHVGKLPV